MRLEDHIELYNLSPTITGKEVDALVATAIERKVFGIKVPPFWVKRAAREMGDRSLSLSTVAGYPFGFQMTEVKMLECELAVRDGATAIDFMFHHTSFANGLPWTKIELAKVSKMLHQHQKLLRVSMDLGLLAEGQLTPALQLATDTGADVVTVTVQESGRLLERVSQLRSLVSPAVGLKVDTEGIPQEQLKALPGLGVDLVGVRDIDFGAF